MSPCKLFTMAFILTFNILLVAHADGPRTISHQGFLVDETGEPVEDNTYIFTFRIYTTDSGGDAIWTEHQVLAVNGGVFNAHLGSEQALDLPFYDQYWVGVAIDGGDELSPRMRLSAAPYAMHAYSVADGVITTEKLAADIDITTSGTVAAGTVNVDGNVTSGNFEYNEPKERYLTIDEKDFRLAISSRGHIWSSFGTGGVGVVESTDRTNALVAPVYLPQNAFVTSIQVFYVDNSSFDMLIAFQRRSLGATGVQSLSSFTTSGQEPGVRSEEIFPNVTIRNDLYSYGLRVFSSGWTVGEIPDMRIYTIKITYQITETD